MAYVNGQDDEKRMYVWYNLHKRKANHPLTGKGKCAMMIL